MGAVKGPYSWQAARADVLSAQHLAPALNVEAGGQCGLAGGYGAALEVAGRGHGGGG